MPSGTTDLRRLRFFVELARDLHFGRSAERQHVSQPTLSQQIKRLELELGVPLFVRPAGTVTLTDAGAELLPQAAALLQHAESFNALAAELARDAARAPADGGREPQAGTTTRRLTVARPRRADASSGVPVRRQTLNGPATGRRSAPDGAWEERPGAPRAIGPHPGGATYATGARGNGEDRARTAGG